MFPTLDAYLGTTDEGRSVQFDNDFNQFPYIEAKSGLGKEPIKWE